MKAVVDHFEEDIAKLEVIGTKQVVCVPRSKLPGVVGEGSVVDDTGGSWQLDNEEAARRRSLSSDLVNSLLK